jgi:hypothetical protein
VLTSKLGEIERKYGLGDQGKVRDDAIFDMYKAHIAQLRTQVRPGWRGGGGWEGGGLSKAGRGANKQHMSWPFR